MRANVGAAGTTFLRLRGKFKRYWAVGVWEEVFHKLLNHGDPAAPPPVDALVALLEGHLQSNREMQRKYRFELTKVCAMLQAGGNGS